MSGALSRVALAAAYRVRRKEPFHALDVSGRCAVALVHVTTADPFRQGAMPIWLPMPSSPIAVPDRMRAMTEVVARKRRIVAAGISNAVVNGVMPVVVVIGCDSVPAAVVRLQRVVRPTLTSICAANCNSLASEPQRPDIRRVRVSDVRLDRLRSCASDGPQR